MIKIDSELPDIPSNQAAAPVVTTQITPNSSLVVVSNSGRGLARPTECSAAPPATASRLVDTRPVVSRPQVTLHAESQHNEPTAARILSLYIDSLNLPNFACKLFEEYFTIEELARRNVNITGKKAKGAGGEKPTALDPSRINRIYDHVMSHINGDEMSRKRMWRSCINAMTKRLSAIKLRTLR